ncbi:MAG TPA: YHS domain-containing protein [Terriglobales bacterium]
MHTDPVCQMQVWEEDAVATAQQSGRTYYFCSQQCADTFKRDPQKYMQAA